ncbi:MAG: hypothetical protein EOP83_32470 [Verrucomicrobiaceae bacterium]|nr:MAG: hypothetical protein EOP83_32470 [Verrucomicrobiaceae bacterium]
MLHEPDLRGSRQASINNDMQMGKRLFDQPSPPLDRAGYERLAADRQSWILEGFLCGQDVERSRLVQELHDSTGQLILALRLSLGRIRLMGGVSESEEFFCESDLIVEQIEKEMRVFSFLHYPTQLLDQGLAIELNNLAAGFGRRTGLDVTFENHCHTDLGKGSAAAALLRVAQEALTNVHRHAHATTVRISLAPRKSKIKLCVIDDGKGLPDKAEHCRTGVGLRSMTQRMESRGGSLTLEGLSPGTKVIASIPADCFGFDLADGA